MFEKIEIEKADNGFILHVNRGVPHIGMSPAPMVFTSERALIKELRTLLKDDKNPLRIISGAKNK